MRLASAEVKRLLTHGHRQVAAADGFAFNVRSLTQRSAQHKEAPEITPHIVMPQATCRHTTHTACTTPTARLATAVPKRLLKRAVDRNRVKRVLRESFRLHAVRTVAVDSLITLQSTPPSKGIKRASYKRTMRGLRIAADAVLSKVVRHVAASTIKGGA